MLPPQNSTAIGKIFGSFSRMHRFHDFKREPLQNATPKLAELDVKDLLLTQNALCTAKQSLRTHEQQGKKTPGSGSISRQNRPAVMTVGVSFYDRRLSRVDASHEMARPWVYLSPTALCERQTFLA
jgi:hypothetical protein